jgi:hypothetical protein
MIYDLPTPYDFIQADIAALPPLINREAYFHSTISSISTFALICTKLPQHVPNSRMFFVSASIYFDKTNVQNAINALIGAWTKCTNVDVFVNNTDNSLPRQCPPRIH